MSCLWKKKPFKLIIPFVVAIFTTELLRTELALPLWHLQICRIMRPISRVMILVQTISSLTAFDWLKISADYFLNDFSFSLLSSCRFSRRAPVTFLLLWMCPRRWEEGRGPPWSFLHLESSEGEENKIK